MMKIVSSHFFAVAAVAALSFNLCHPFTEGRELSHVEFSDEVVCLPESPEVCVGSFHFSAPSALWECDEQDDNCNGTYIGNYDFDYVFVEGLEEGTSYDVFDNGDDAKTGLEIDVTIEPDKSACEITVVTESGTETCTMCTPVNCENSFGNNGIAYDCTNLENGRSSTSECLQSIFYPFDATVAVPSHECPEDVILKHQIGYTEFPADQIVEIVSQDIQTVTVKLNQAWTTGVGEITAPIDHIYASFRETIFDNRCYETESVDEGYFDTYTITCNVSSPKAYLEICVADNLAHEVLTPRDNAEVPKCCYPTFPANTPVVCYSLIINCVTECIDETIQQRKLLRGGEASSFLN